MNKKRLLGLILFAELVIAALFLGAGLMVSQGKHEQAGVDQIYTKDEEPDEKILDANITEAPSQEASAEAMEDLHQKATNEIQPKSLEDTVQEKEGEQDTAQQEPTMTEVTVTPIAEVNADTADTYSTSIKSDVTAPQLICDSNAVDYMSYIPEMNYDSEIEIALDIQNPDITLDAKSAILFDAKTKEVLYYKNPVEAMFPASTAKLLTSVVALEWCDEEEEVTVGDEITMIADDSTKAFLKQEQVLTIRNLLTGMLLPSGNDAAYVVANYVGKKSLENPEALKEEAVAEFVRLMNEEAKKLGVKNSCFKTPDGYDAIGQYTTAYDMGLIGIAAANNRTITEISSKDSSRNIFISGEDVTWDNYNKLVKRYSGQYYSYAIGLKTGTTTIAGRCIIAAAEKDGRKVVCAVLNSTSAGRYEDAIALLKNGLQ